MVEIALWLFVATNVAFLAWAALRYRVKTSRQWQLRKEVLNALNQLDEAQVTNRLQRYRLTTLARIAPTFSAPRVELAHR